MLRSCDATALFNHHMTALRFWRGFGGRYDETTLAIFARGMPVQRNLLRSDTSYRCCDGIFCAYVPCRLEGFTMLKLLIMRIKLDRNLRKRAAERRIRAAAAKRGKRTELHNRIARDKLMRARG